MTEARKVPLLNVANILTMARLALVPVFLFSLFEAGGFDTTWRLIAFGIFAVASFTDHIDGTLARKHGLITDFGKIADPIADKALTGSALVGLSMLDVLPWWITITIAVREVGITLLRFWVIRYGVIPASRGGKAKTLAQVIAIGLFVLPQNDVLELIAWAIMAVALVLTIVTGIDYVIRAFKMKARAGRAVL
ncbi:MULTISPECIES: CDP-diacylglycerol--glycerol-3-phosphate 3-phosphatidyltransferase [Lentzea]|jgi:CDP-diacylglycerol--glycerol-3-phosphate 3-phosphatidyltransferase|uniref:CDP-diacylglycerol--glycerol-3-phosphate 3-phosphatidyltransferase n=1 Tax=Lentzea flaviverrucosa TaxID=200379 RepID=A0A1H9XXM2_9PSEU|nr:MULTISPECIES: CDP-diacylglycerol--glycerol-3-phosphate 3-phosphatidyltransferase [Lentzea]MCR3748471.1 CDP-diacylglycerol--glycerol-3-phosphate 3-phosphatidyltransferase [Lentzea californiensis]RDI27904.1 CDP-diacylglycerol--glycerol-3-phosphate 3-phosphatidyltransferase [Lentzea flaviverrucosa]SES50940.1 CDP-diacylglycerol--glycerol-3-phosphate 3-phosphatidyltransferase [Lentzea flaviverrucosa]